MSRTVLTFDDIFHLDPAVSAEALDNPVRTSTCTASVVVWCGIANVHSKSLPHDSTCTACMMEEQPCCFLTGGGTTGRKTTAERSDTAGGSGAARLRDQHHGPSRPGQVHQAQTWPHQAAHAHAPHHPLLAGKRLLVPMCLVDPIFKQARAVLVHLLSNRGAYSAPLLSMPIFLLQPLAGIKTLGTRKPRFEACTCPSPVN